MEMRDRMNPLKERRTVTTTKAITTLFIGSALLVVGFMGMMSMPQMIVPAQAQSQGAENACKELQGLENLRLERGKCIADAEETVTFTCDPSTLAGIPVTRSGSTCSATGATNVITGGVCDAVEGDRSVSGGRDPQATCTFDATETVTLTCPGDIEPTNEGECITKPGDRSEEEV